MSAMLQDGFSIDEPSNSLRMKVTGPVRALLTLHRISICQAGEHIHDLVLRAPYSTWLGSLASPCVWIVLAKASARHTAALAVYAVL